MENKKSNQQRLEEYLVVGNKEKNVLGYLKSDISNGKVIMLSGKWGSGKTHFWQNKIQTVLNGNDKDKKIPNNYISLYGKTTIEEIRNEVFLKIFESMDIFKIDDKSFGLAKNTANLVADLTKTVSVFGFNLDLSKIVDKSFEKLEKVKENNKNKKTKECLNSGAIICFDDFERKSKDIDLNDLFGFITHLTLNFDCKVVIILNDDVFEGEEKKIFSNVKEKSVSKFLKYEPTIKELFETIFISDKRYRKLDDYKEIILRTIEETQELNARIYIQVLDNLVEWVEKNQEINDEKYIRYLIFQNINFINNHFILLLERIFDNEYNQEEYSIRTLFQKKLGHKKEDIEVLINKIIRLKLHTFEKDFPIRSKTEFNILTDNEIKSVYFSILLNVFSCKKYLSIKLDENIQCKINNFIESGILINE